MRYAVLIIGLMLTIGLFFQSMAGSALSGLAEDDELGNAAAIGVWMAFLWLVACGFVIPKPRVSAVLFLLAAPFGALGWSEFPDLQFWSVVSAGLAVMSYLGFRGKQKDRAKEEQRDDLMRQMVAYQAAIAGGKSIDAGPIQEGEFVSADIARPPAVSPGGKLCPACGGSNPISARFCSLCGTAQ